MSRIRRASKQDNEAIVAIYNHYVTETPITFDIEPFSVESRRPCFEAFADGGRHQLFVAEADGAVAGYAASHPFRAKAAYDTSIETTIYLDPKMAGRGLGSELYEVLFEALAGADIHRALAGITTGNPASVALHQRFGFRSIGLMTGVGRKFDRYWDVECFEKQLS